MKIMSVVGARPQFVKLAPMDRAIRAAGHQHVIVHTGQHYDPMLSDVFFSELGIAPPDVHLGVGSGSHGVQTGTMLAAMDGVIAEHSPDWVLVYGDTNSTVAAALAAVKMHVKVAHLEAGLRSFNRRMPEEHNRVLTDHAADLLLAPTEVAARHLANEGLAGRTVEVGDVMTDILLSRLEDLPESALAAELGLQPQSYFLATIHRAENTDDPARLRAVLAGLASIDAPVVLLAHPRLVASAERQGLELAAGNVIAHEPVSYDQLLAAARGAAGIVTDSGGLQKEAFLLRVPCTTVRTETEWTETVALGWNELVEPADIARSASRPRPAATDEAPYGTGDAAERAVSAMENARP